MTRGPTSPRSSASSTPTPASISTSAGRCRGTYDLAVVAQSAQTGTFQIVRVVRVTLTP
jgi:hypothetical protein